jgi:uncharacterized repeat protein (TIGR01451 family)
MWRNVRFWGYVCGVLVLAGLLLAGSHAWATPVQVRRNQTVPTPTPKGQPLPTLPPLTEPPEATEPPETTEPSVSSTPAPSTPAPGGTPFDFAQDTPAGQPTATAAPALVLIAAVNREQAWPGITLHYTLTLINRGTAPAEQVTLTDILPEGLELTPLPAGSPAVWDGRTLRAEIATLPTRGRLIVVFSAVVRADAAPGQVLVNQATATAVGDPSAALRTGPSTELRTGPSAALRAGLQVDARVAVALPPAELPPTGDISDF